MKDKNSKKRKNSILLTSGKIRSKKFFLYNKREIKVFRELSDEDWRGNDFPEFFENSLNDFHILSQKIDAIEPMAESLRQSLYFPTIPIYNRDTMEIIQQVGQDITSCADVLQMIYNRYHLIWEEGLKRLNEINNLFIEKRNKENL